MSWPEAIVAIVVLICGTLVVAMITGRKDRTQRRP